MKKTKDKELLEKIKKVLIKKAEGYFYNEEVFEYQIEDKKVKKETSNQMDIFELENGEKVSGNKDKQQKEADLTLLKKKVTTHYVPPDLLAVKMLVEIYGEKIDSVNELYNLDYDKLLELKNDLLKQLKEE